MSFSREQWLKFINIRSGNIIFVSQFFDEVGLIMKSNMFERNSLKLNYKEHYKGRAFFVCKNIKKENMLYGFELRSKKPKSNFIELPKKNKDIKYIKIDKLYLFKYEYILNPNRINKYFVMGTDESRTLAKKILAD